MTPPKLAPSPLSAHVSRCGVQPKNKTAFVDQATSRAQTMLGRPVSDVVDADAAAVALALRAVNGTCAPAAFDRSVFTEASQVVERHGAPFAAQDRARLLRQAYRADPALGKAAYIAALADAREALRQGDRSSHASAMLAAGYPDTLIDEVLALDLELTPADYKAVDAALMQQLVNVLARCGNEYWLRAKGSHIKMLLANPQASALLASAELLLDDRKQHGSILETATLMQALTQVRDVTAFAESLPALRSIASYDDWQMAIGFVAEGVDGEMAAAVLPLLGKHSAGVAHRLPEVARMASFESAASLVEATQFFNEQGVGNTVAAQIVARIEKDGVACAPSDFSVERFGGLLGRVASQDPPLGFDSIAAIAGAVDYIHDNDTTGRDLVRKGFVAALDAPALFATMAADGIHTSTYYMLRERLMAGGSLSTRLSALDPLGLQLQPFVQALARFRDVTLYSQASESLLGPALGLIHFADDAVLLLPLLAAHMPGDARVEAALCDAIDGAKGGKVPSPAAFLLRVFFERGQLRGERALALAPLLPPLPSSAPPLEAWRKDGVISAQLFYYPDERALDDTRARLIEEGFTLKQSFRESGCADECDINLTLERKRNGLVQRVILTQSKDPSTRAQALESEHVDIVAHRGHSYHFHESVPMQALTVSSDKLIYGGGCNGYSAMSSEMFLRYYGHAHLAADSDKGEGAVNDAVLLSILNNASKPEAASWDDLFPARFLAKGVVPPHDPSMLMARYMSLLAAP